MTRWQRRTRIVIAVAGVAFAIVVASQFQRREPAPESAAVPRSDPSASIESTKGRSSRVNIEHEDVRIEYDRLTGYEDGSTKMSNVTVVTERSEGRTFTITAREGKAGKNDADITVSGDVRMSVSDGLVVRTEQATYTDAEGMVRADGAVTFSRDRMSGSGVGMTYNKNSDVLAILDQAVVHMQPDAHGTDRIDIVSGTAVFTRPEKTVRFDRGINVTRDFEVTEADAGVGQLSRDEQRLEALALRGRSRITGSRGGPGMFKSLSGRDVDLRYRSDGRSIERAHVTGGASLEVAGERNQMNRQISASSIDVALAADGSTPTAVIARERVQLTMPADKSTPARTITADAMDGTGTERQGLTAARFTGNVQFVERGADRTRTARSAALDVNMGQGLSNIDDARFSRGVRFQEGSLTATAAAARYILEKGTLELTGSEPGFLVPHLRNERIDVGAARIDVVLDVPKITASGNVGSTLRPARKQAGGTASGGSDPKVPSMLKADQEVQVTANDLQYDGEASRATYSGNASLWQGETKIKGASIVIDDKTGDLTAAGGVTTNAMLVQEDTDHKKTRMSSRGSAKDFRYEESLRRATYEGTASLIDAQGDLRAETIDVYLKPSGDEIERVEARRQVQVTVVEKRRTATGDELHYFSADERYEIKGKPVTIVDECARKNEGLTLTFFRATDRIILNGSPQNVTHTKSDGSNCR